MSITVAKAGNKWVNEERKQDYDEKMGLRKSTKRWEGRSLQLWQRLKRHKPKTVLRNAGDTKAQLPHTVGSIFSTIDMFGKKRESGQPIRQKQIAKPLGSSVNDCKNLFQTIMKIIYPKTFTRGAHGPSNFPRLAEVKIRHCLKCTPFYL